MSLVARQLERSGISTVCFSICLEVTQRVRPPRAVYLRFPFGHPLGEPGRRAQQGHLLELALKLLVEATPEQILQPGYRWRVSAYPGEEGSTR